MGTRSLVGVAAVTFVSMLTSMASAESQSSTERDRDLALRAAYEEADVVRRDERLREVLDQTPSKGWNLEALAEMLDPRNATERAAVGCGVVQTFDAGLPSGWQVVNNSGGNPVVWAPLVTCGEGGNYTNGSGDVMCASSDLQGGGSGLYDTELITPTFGLPDGAPITLSYTANYQNFAQADFLDLDISVNFGGWVNLRSWNEDQGSFRATPGTDVEVDLSAYSGEFVRLRWHYYDPSGPDTSQDWYAQIDNVELSCGPPAIDHRLTVGIDPGVCSSTSVLLVSPGTDVYYCHEVENVGGLALGLHDVTNSEFGTLLSNFPFDLIPASTVFLDPSGTTEEITENVVRTSEWTAYNPGPVNVVSDTDAAFVFVPEPEPLTCGGPQVEFSASIPLDWSVLNNAPGNPVVWAAQQDCGEAGNYTGGGLGAACASSDLQGAGLYDTELRSPTFSLAGVSAPIELAYSASYQNFAFADLLDVDISTNGGASWTNLLSWNEDHGAYRGLPGEDVSIDLSAFAGLSNLLLRWHYYDPTGPENSEDWYAQVDNVRLRSPSCDLFSDGFESGDTSAWSNTVP